MRCLSLTEFGKPLTPETRSDLMVTGSEVLLRVTANGVCHSDLHIREGCYKLGHGQTMKFAERGLKLPLVMGHEPVGRIIAVGPDAGDPERDKDFIIYPWQGCGECHQCKTGHEHYCGKPRFLGMFADGGYADMIKIPHPRYLFDIGDIRPEFAAPLACSGLTTYSALKKVKDTIKAVPVVIIGAGGLGLMAIGLVKAMGGLPPIVVDIDSAKRAAALEAGAAAIIDGAAEDAVGQLQAAAGGQVFAVIDLVGAESTAGLAFNAVDKGGKIVIVGLFGGAAPWPLPLITVKAVSIMGSYVGSLMEFAELMELAKAGKVPALPTQTAALEDAENTLNRLKKGEIVGRAILMP